MFKMIRFGIGLTLAAATLSGSGQTLDELYLGVLARLCPIRASPDEKHASRTIAIREIPGESIDKERYAFIVIQDDGSISAQFKAPKKRSIFSQLRSFADEKSDPAAVARKIDMTCVGIADGPKLRRILEDYAMVQIPVRLEKDVILDATRFDICETTPMNSWTATIYTPRDVNRNKLIAWARSALDSLGSEVKPAARTVKP